MGRPLTLADGQLAAAAATILAGADSPPSGHVAVTLQNTSESEETILLTFRLNGGTARRLARIVLAGNEQAIVSGIPLQPDDTLLAYTTTASVVDYLVLSSPVCGLRVDVLDAEGTGKGVTAIRKVLMGMEYLTDGELLPA